MTDAETEDRLQTLWAEREIRQVIAIACRGLDRRDDALLASAFHPRARVDQGAFSGNAEDFASFVIDALASAGFTMGAHHVTTSQVELDGSTAHAETYVFGTAAKGGQDGTAVVLSVGRYDDVFELRDGAWRIAQRTYVPTLSATIEGPLATP